MKAQINHIKALNKFVELGLMDSESAKLEESSFSIGLIPCKFSVWTKRNEQMQYKGVWFELYRNETARDILGLWLDGDFSDDAQIRVYNPAQSDLISRTFG